MIALSRLTEETGVARNDPEQIPLWRPSRCFMQAKAELASNFVIEAAWRTRGVNDRLIGHLEWVVQLFAWRTKSKRFVPLVRGT